MDSSSLVYFEYEWLGEKKIGTKIREVKLSDGTTCILMSDNSSQYKYPIRKKNVKKFNNIFLISRLVVYLHYLKQIKTKQNEKLNKQTTGIT